MQLISLTLLCTTAVVVVASTTTACNADNCLRAIRASAFPTRMGTADCSSYFRTTVTPATSTFTATTTVYSTIANKRRRNAAMEARAPEPVLEVRQHTVAPSSIPTYASACSGAARYSSACSCIGVTAMTTTAPAPSTTKTVTATATTTVANGASVPFTGYFDASCLNQDGVNGVFVQDQCVGLPVQISIEDTAFTPGLCPGVTAAQCTISLYSDGACTVPQSSVAATPGCLFVGYDFSGRLTCPPCSL